MRHTSLAVARAVALIVAGGGTLLGAGVVLGGAARPSAAAPAVYAELTKSGTGWSNNPTSVNYTWEFSDGTRVVSNQSIRSEFKMGRDDHPTAAGFVNAIAAQGWDLISHSERTQGIPPDISNGTSVGSGQFFITEHWWFKRR
jgi:hypothetical protein